MWSEEEQVDSLHVEMKLEGGTVKVVGITE
jgi:hypothetical protein